jgi:hypothetical protein
MPVTAVMIWAPQVLPAGQSASTVQLAGWRSTQRGHCESAAQVSSECTRK